MRLPPFTFRLSLTTRLSLLYTVVAASMLLGMGWLSAMTMESHFVELDLRTLQDKLHLIEQLATTSDSTAVFSARLDEVLHSHAGLIVRIHDADLPIYGSPALDGLLARPQPERPTLNPDLFLLRNEAQEFRALRADMPALQAPGVRWTVWVALDIQHHAHFNADFKNTMALYVLLATLFSGVLGWLAARKGLSPLRTMKSRARAVTVDNLEERMPVHAVPVEMADLAHSLNEMLARLQAAFTRLSQFSSDLAHELRTPISNLLTETQVTLSQSRTVAAYEDVLASNSEELQRLARMVSDMLFLAKTENSLALPSRVLVNLADEVHAMFDFYEALASDKQVQLALTGQAQVLGDRLMLRRALSNLLSNAVRHSPAQAQVRVELTVEQDATLVSVENVGTDIEAALLPRLFDRFFRVDQARSHPDSDGVGLGLAITRAIVLAHGGQVGVTSSDGHTRFSMRFPSRAGAGPG